MSLATLIARAMLFLLAAGAAVAVIPTTAAAQAQRDWTTTIVPTAEGGFRMGNPNAPIQLVEFVSLTCPHCRNFAGQGAPSVVSDYVRSGRASFEIRPFPLDFVAAIAAQLGRCAPPAHAFALNDAILASQDEWIGRLEALTRQQIAEIEALPPGQLRQRIALVTGLDRLAAQHGVAAAGACLADQAASDRIDAIKAAAEALGVHGTPSFTLNGRLLEDVYDWASLEPRLRAGR
jgi:protein-disulfide isomerase